MAGGAGSACISRVFRSISREIYFWAQKLSDVRDEPRTQSGRANRTSSAAAAATANPTPTASPHERRGDTLVRNFWGNRDCVIDVRCINLDADSYWTKDRATVLLRAEKDKKKKHLKDCIDSRRDFTPFIVSRDALLAKEANSFTKCVATKLAKRWTRCFSSVCGYVKGRLGLAIVRATARCLYGSRVPARLISRSPAWADGAGLGLWETLSDS